MQSRGIQTDEEARRDQFEFKTLCQPAVELPPGLVLELLGSRSRIRFSRHEPGIRIQLRALRMDSGAGIRRSQNSDAAPTQALEKNSGRGQFPRHREKRLNETNSGASELLESSAPKSLVRKKNHGSDIERFHLMDVTSE